MKSRFKQNFKPSAKHMRKEHKYLASTHKRNLRKNLGLCAPKPETKTGCFESTEGTQVEIDVLLSCTDFDPSTKPFGMVKDAQSHFHLDTIDCDATEKTGVWNRTDGFGITEGGPCYFLSTACTVDVKLLAAAGASTDLITHLSQYLDKALTNYIDSQHTDPRDIGYAVAGAAGVILLLCCCMAISSRCCNRPQTAHVIHNNLNAEANQNLLGDRQHIIYGE